MAIENREEFDIRIVVEGGPASGKSTVIMKIEHVLKSMLGTDRVVVDEIVLRPAGWEDGQSQRVIGMIERLNMRILIEERHIQRGAKIKRRGSVATAPSSGRFGRASVIAMLRRAAGACEVEYAKYAPGMPLIHADGTSDKFEMYVRSLPPSATIERGELMAYEFLLERLVGGRSKFNKSSFLALVSSANSSAVTGFRENSGGNPFFARGSMSEMRWKYYIGGLPPKARIFLGEIMACQWIRDRVDGWGSGQ